MRHFKLLARIGFAVSLAVSLFSPRPAQAVEPGVDIAAPRVAISTTGDYFGFTPADIVVEQGDYIRWKFIGISYSHTTTSGNVPLVCNVWSGLWDAPLNSLSPQYTRPFLETPQSIPYFCNTLYHCSIYGMHGQVTVTTVIDVTATDTAGLLTLTWVGGGGLYRVFRSGTPAFTGTGTAILTPSGGTTQMSISDTAQPSPGSAAFYLVMNQF